MSAIAGRRNQPVVTSASARLTVVLAFPSIWSLISSLWYQEWSLLSFRLVVLATVLAVGVVLHSRVALIPAVLRSLGFVGLGVVGLQLVVGRLSALWQFALQGDAAAAAVAAFWNYAAWSLLILVYGNFVPNSWQRAARVLLPAAIVPVIVLLVARWQCPPLGPMLNVPGVYSLWLLPLVAALVAIYAAHMSESARGAAFAARRFGQYRLTEKIGGGGMGIVYKAEHLLLKRPCALKLIRTGRGVESQFLARFEREVRATAQLTHWNTIQIYDFGQSADGAFYYVMELLQGANLGDLVRRSGPLPPPRIVHLLRQTCGALMEAHASGLVHRDIKPENIFAASIGGVYDVAKLLDFGVVYETSDLIDVRLTARGTIVGTASYMAPEQVTASPAIGPAADLYSVGAVAYFLLTGRPPFAHENSADVMIAHLRDEPVPPSTRVPDIPADLEQIVLRCLAKNPHDRYADSRQLEQALAACDCAGLWTQEQAAAWWQRNGG